MVAAGSLATSDGDLRTRLHGAYLAMHTLNHCETAWANEEDRARFAGIVERLTRVEDPARGSIRATLETLPPEELKAIAEELWSLFLDYARLDAEAQAASAVGGRPK